MQAKVSTFAPSKEHTADISNSELLAELREPADDDTLDFQDDEHEAVSEREFAELLQMRKDRALAQRENFARLVSSV